MTCSLRGRDSLPFKLFTEKNYVDPTHIYISFRYYKINLDGHYSMLWRKFSVERRCLLTIWNKFIYKAVRTIIRYFTTKLHYVYSSANFLSNYQRRLMHQNTVIVKNIDRIVLFLYCSSSNTSFAPLQRLGQYHHSDHLQKARPSKW